MRKIMKNRLFTFVLPLVVLFTSCNFGNLNKNVEYTVSYYLQNIDDDEYTFTESETVIGTEGDFVNITPKTFEGFTAKDLTKTKITEGMNFVINYDRNIITINLNYNGGTIISENGIVLESSAVTGRYGAKINLPEPQKTGYILEAWYATDGTELTETFTKSGTYLASYIAKIESTYTVHHFLQNIENDEYTEDKIKFQVLQGITGTKTNAAALDISGFIPKYFEQQTVSADGSTEINIYYNRKLITFTFNLSGGEGQSSITKKYGSAVTVQPPVKKGAEFSGWSPDLPQAFTENTTFTAIYDMPSYKVKYLFENLADSDYSEDDAYPVETYLGTVGQITNIAAKPVKGFIPQVIEQKTILEDNSTVVEVKYNRRLITIFIDLKNGVGTNYIQGKFGQGNDAVAKKLMELAKPSRVGYNLNVDNIYDYSNEVEFSLEYDETTSISVNWIGGVSSIYEVVVYKEKMDYEGAGDRYDEMDRIIYSGKSGEFTDAKIKNTNSVVINDKSWSYDYYKPCAFENIEIEGNETTVLYIIFDRVYVDVTFKLNGGNVNGNTSDIVVNGKYNSKFEMPKQLNNVDRSGYRFDVWDKSFDKFPENDVIVNAKWNANTYKVILHNNEQIEEKEFTYDQPFVIPSLNTLSVITGADGCGLSGWSLTEAGEVNYYPETSKIFEKPENIDLYARWANNYYKIRIYEERKDSPVYGQPEYSILSERTLYVPAGTKSDFIPEEKTGFEILPFEQITVQEDNSSELNIYYKRNVYTLKFVLGEGGFAYINEKDEDGNYKKVYSLPDVQVKYGADYVTKDYRPQKIGFYTSRYHWVLEDGTEVSDFNPAYSFTSSSHRGYTIENVTSDMTVYLTGTMVKYNVTLKYTNNSGIRTEYTVQVDSEDYSLPELSLDGYEFRGWYYENFLKTSVDINVHSIKEAVITEPFNNGIKNVELCAKWVSKNHPTESTTIKSVGDIVLKNGNVINIPSNNGKPVIEGLFIELTDEQKNNAIGVASHKVGSEWRIIGKRVANKAMGNFQSKYSGNDSWDYLNLSNGESDDGYKVYEKYSSETIDANINTSPFKFLSNNSAAWKYVFDYGTTYNFPINYQTGWYIAGINELKAVSQNYDDISIMLNVIEGDQIDQTGFIWACGYYVSPYRFGESLATCAYHIYDYANFDSNKRGVATLSYNYCVLAFHKFN